MANKKKLQFEFVLDDPSGGLRSGDYEVEKLTLRIRDSVFSRLDQPAQGRDNSQSRKTPTPAYEENLIDLEGTPEDPLVDLAITVQTGAQSHGTEVYEEVEDVMSDEEKTPSSRRGSRAQEIFDAVKTGKRNRQSSEGQDNSPMGRPNPAGALPSSAKAPITSFRFSGHTGAVEKRRTLGQNPEGAKGAVTQILNPKTGRPVGGGTIAEWRPTLSADPKDLEHCMMISCGIRMISADRRGHALTVHLPPFFGNQYEETRLTARQKMKFRWEFVDILLKFRGLDTAQKRTKAALKEILSPTFTTTSMAPLDRVTVEDYCEKEGVTVPKTWVLAEMGTLGLSCWQGGMALLRDLNSEEMEVLHPELNQIGLKLLSMQRKL